MTDFGDDIGNEAMQRAKRPGIAQRLAARAATGKAERGSNGVGRGDAVEQIDFDTPADARAAADELGRRGVEAHVAGASVAVRASAISELERSGGLAAMGEAGRQIRDALRAGRPDAPEVTPPSAVPRVREEGAACAAASERIAAERAVGRGEKAVSRSVPMR